ncbi:MAG: site-2 protease family protein [Planctomycetota bacterium]|nr:MAG: site-2 protease family protein [Planctomycetota bacterium]REK44181.1 MAG: site-2 protease family protein [Planctomycetota bacterium]
MKWSWRIARVAGVDIYLHWTFLLLIGWILFSYLMAGADWLGVWTGVGFVLALFVCVVLHELGHAMAARVFGIPTRDITILPIGGVARLDHIPEHPRQEFVIAIAGPLVNVVIAAVLAVLTLGLMGAGHLGYGALLTGRFLQNLMWANILLVLFNLIPAFPMDGGRMLRAGLATFLEYSTATRIAAGVGQVLAILFAVGGLFVFNNPFLLFIALFVYLGAAGEAQMAEVRSMLRGIPVREAMMTRFQALSPNDSLQTAATELLAGMQQEFPVVEEGRLVGMLRRADLAEGLRGSTGELRIADVMTQDCRCVNEFDLLERVMYEMHQGSCSVLPVVRGDRIIGLVDTENIGELLMIRSARGNGTPAVRHPGELISA